MQTGANPTTLLEAQDLFLTRDFRDTTCREIPTRPPGGGHDFLVLTSRPDLTPDFFAGEIAREAVHSCERNIPQK